MSQSVCVLMDSGSRPIYLQMRSTTQSRSGVDIYRIPFVHNLNETADDLISHPARTECVPCHQLRNATKFDMDIASQIIDWLIEQDFDFKTLKILRDFPDLSNPRLWRVISTDEANIYEVMTI